MFRKLIALTVLLAIQFSGALAQNEGPVTSELTAFKITTDESGEEVATEVAEIQPADTIEYRLTYTNNSDGAISNLVPVLPIPAGMQYLEDTASPVLNAASTQTTGDDFQAPPLTRTVTTEDGEQVTEQVPTVEYRRLQWTVSTLEAGASVTLTARVLVNEMQ